MTLTFGRFHTVLAHESRLCTWLKLALIKHVKLILPFTSTSIQLLGLLCLMSCPVSLQVTVRINGVNPVTQSWATYDLWEAYGWILCVPLQRFWVQPATNITTLLRPAVVKKLPTTAVTHTSANTLVDSYYSSQC